MKNEFTKHIFVTHIHLDHSGGAGLFLTSCPNAKLMVHPKGARHIVDPSRLIASAKRVYGDQFDELFDPILPVPAERIVEMEDGGTIALDGRVLKFIHTPGHANHHFSIYDEKSNGIFTGDTAGVRYAELTDEGEAFYLPTTSPNQFNTNDMRLSIEKMMSFNPDRIYFGHYGMSEEPELAVGMVLTWLDIFMDITEENKVVHNLVKALLENITRYLSGKGIPISNPVYDIIKIDLNVCAQGIILYKGQ